MDEALVSMVAQTVYWTDGFHCPQVSARSWQGLSPLKQRFQGTWACSTPEGAPGMVQMPFVNSWEGGDGPWEALHDFRVQ